MVVRLKHPPLVEAILELRWELDRTEAGLARDANFSLVAAHFQEAVTNAYPFVEELPAAQLPHDLTPHVVKYRFRSQENQWPLVQIGPGVVSLNFTKPYDWEAFWNASLEMRQSLLHAFSASRRSVPNVDRFLLRYINATPLLDNEPLEFIESKLNVSVRLPSGFSWALEEETQTSGVDIRITKTIDQIGSGSLRIFQGTHEGASSVIWEQSIQSERTPLLDDQAFTQWLSDSHDLIESWFLALIDGELAIQFGVEQSK